MKISDKVKQYCLVMAVTGIAVIIYMVCYGQGRNPLISIDANKSMDYFVRVLTANHGVIEVNILEACEYNLQSLVMFVLGTVFQNFWTGINVYYIGSFFMISAAMYWFLQKLEISLPIATGIAVLTAFLPFHVDRGEGQLITANFFLAPLLLGMLYDLIYQKQTENGYRKGYLLLVCIAPFVDVRISIMTILLFGVLILHRQDWYAAKHLLGYFLPLVILSIIEGALVSSLYVYQVEDSLQMAQGEGLRLLDMLMPMRYHVIDRLSDLRLKYDIDFSVSGENGLNTMGFLFTIGFLWKMCSLFYGKKGDKRIAWLGWIDILVIVIANVQGLNLLLEYAGCHVIYWNRMGIFILVGAAATLAIMAERLKEWTQAHGGKAVITLGYVILLAAGIIGFLELLLRQESQMFLA